MKTTHTLSQNSLINSALIITLTAALGLTGCDQKGPAEKAGQKIDQAADSAKQNIKQTTNNATQTLENAKDTLEQKADKAEAYIEKSTDTSKATLEKTGENIDSLNKSAQQNIAEMQKNAEKKLDVAKDALINKTENATAYVDDSVITLKVKAAIDNDPALKASKLEITTVDGIVKVTGSVDSLQSQARVVEVINSQADVKSVQNDTTIHVILPSK